MCVARGRFFGFLRNLLQSYFYLRLGLRVRGGRSVAGTAEDVFTQGDCGASVGPVGFDTPHAVVEVEGVDEQEFGIEYLDLLQVQPDPE